MSRYRPSPPQLRALQAVAAGRVTYVRIGPCVDNGTGDTYSAATIRRLSIEEMILEPQQYGEPYTVTDDGRALLAALDGA